MGYGNILDNFFKFYVPIVKARLLMSHISAEIERIPKTIKINGE